MTTDDSQPIARLQSAGTERFTKACGQARQDRHALVVVYRQLVEHFPADETPGGLVIAKVVEHAISH